MAASDSFPDASCIFLQHLAVTDLVSDFFLFVVQFQKAAQILRMDELASVAVGAVAVEMKRLAQLRFVHRWYVYLFLQLMLSMGEGTVVPIFAAASRLEAGAEFSLLFNFVVSGQQAARVFECERILLEFLESRWIRSLGDERLEIVKIAELEICARLKLFRVDGRLGLRNQAMSRNFGFGIHANLNRDLHMIDGTFFLVNLTLVHIRASWMWDNVLLMARDWS